MANSLWLIIKDSMVKHVWECADCNNRAEVEPWWYSENGTPVCERCDIDMEYYRTELNVGEYRGYEMMP
jgi:hypothetical protein